MLSNQRRASLYGQCAIKTDAKCQNAAGTVLWHAAYLMRFTVTPGAVRVAAPGFSAKDASQAIGGTFLMPLTLSVLDRAWNMAHWLFFFGLILHLVINGKGYVSDFISAPEYADDRDPVKQGTFLKNINGSCAPTEDF